MRGGGFEEPDMAVVWWTLSRCLFDIALKTLVSNGLRSEDGWACRHVQVITFQSWLIHNDILDFLEIFYPET